MIKADFVQFKQGMMMFAEVYRVEVNQAQMSIYWDALENLAIDDYLAAIRRHIADPDQGQWFPKPANLIKQVYGTEAQSAWQALCEELARGGADVGPKTHLALAGIGGMYQVRRMSTDQLMGMKRQFISNYCADLSEKPAAIGSDTANRIE